MMKLINPLKNSSKDNITSLYGYRTHPVTGEQLSFHTGIDLANGCGTDVVAAAAGKVTKKVYPYPNCTNCGSVSYGNYIDIDHGNGWYTRYGHLKTIYVNVGDVVSSGYLVGLSGSTGISTGCHLHFEVRKKGHVAINGGESMDPYPFIFGSEAIDSNYKDEDESINTENRFQKNNKNNKKDEFIFIRRRNI